MAFDPLIKKDVPMPVDPSNTSSVGEQVEQGVVKIKEGLTEQSSEWEDKDKPGATSPDSNKLT